MASVVTAYSSAASRPRPMPATIDVPPAPCSTPVMSMTPAKASTSHGSRANGNGSRCSTEVSSSRKNGWVWETTVAMAMPLNAYAENSASQLSTSVTPPSASQPAWARDIRTQPRCRVSTPSSAAPPNRQRKNTTSRGGWPLVTTNQPMVPDSTMAATMRQDPPGRGCCEDMRNSGLANGRIVPPIPQINNGATTQLLFDYKSKTGDPACSMRRSMQWRCLRAWSSAAASRPPRKTSA
ncbi:hypothetical protein CBM2617_A30041 [Cupriavidus taiwanensis]|nr:hypothetical protein CBM2617_A30041 [Cupriavidus taiwanensis]SOZ82269.1 hypothetical protein CBM2622_A40034 [Cupriavidus taiwanensis]SPD39966.1 protein of unknown function [Cupriavidus taiwanensis]